MRFERVTDVIELGKHIQFRVHFHSIWIASELACIKFLGMEHTAFSRIAVAV